MYAKRLILAASMLSMLPAISHAQPALPPLVGCKEFAAMPESQQLAFVYGLGEGAAIVVSLLRVLAKDLESDATTESERALIEKMEKGPQAFLYSDPNAPGGKEMVKAMIAKCTSDSAGLTFMNILAGR